MSKTVDFIVVGAGSAGTFIGSNDRFLKRIKRPTVIICYHSTSFF